MDTNTIITPTMKPPMCAQYATPPAMLREDKRSCSRNQTPRKIAAGIGMIQMNLMSTRVSIFAFGYITMYAPRTPEIAPEAPKVGIASSEGDVRLRMCARSAAKPHPR